ncbi:hypothetical protein [Hyperthermus butylicus]|uniref:Uncharacterized protein n=1 Tax=Hyperthermus butylicus (strain DSM 5456 / JCM 9403 / PLM1-5) TaxID=415426 RepID=A2BLJ1_HYPBU|nr:hypothetical protein [Hyperthermus butylicus]ABM80852.1 hypothetical protein Hbut_1005 [Hyperthermus butylicus DSM 5456]
MAERVLDLRAYTALCGDYSVHLLGKLEQMSSGEKLKVYVAKSSAGLLKESVKAITSAGLAELAGEGEEGDAYYVILVKR